MKQKSIKVPEKDQLHKNPKVQFEEHYIHLNTPRFTYFIRFLVFFKDNFQLQNIIMLLFFTKNAYLLTVQITLDV